MGVLLPNYPQDIVVKGENVPHFGKMSGNKMRACNGTLNVFQILGDIWKQQLAVQIQYDSSTIPELASPLRTTTPSTQAPTMATAKQANPVHVNAFPVQNTSWSGPPASETQRIVSLEKSSAPAQWKDFCEKTPTGKARHSVTLLQLL